MSPKHFEGLLYEDEGTTLDFKKEQYPFPRATDSDKAELLKDILGFANTWRRSEAFVLIGVEHVRGARSNVVGIMPSDHLLDHNLQQFVNNLTNKPIVFCYEAFAFEGKQVGIITISQQKRPFYLKRDYGPLVKGAVYVRRGSSTDPQQPALPDEIAAMGTDLIRDVAELRLEFSDPMKEQSIGTTMVYTAERCEMPVKETIPDYQPSTQPPWGYLMDPTNTPNNHFFREYADYEFVCRLYRPVRLVVQNAGQIAATNVHVEIDISSKIDVAVFEADEFPERPERRFDRIALKHIKPIKLPFPRVGKITVEKNAERFRVDLACGDLQPGRHVWSDIFYVGKRTSGEVNLDCKIFAANGCFPFSWARQISPRLRYNKRIGNEL